MERLREHHYCRWPHSVELCTLLWDGTMGWVGKVWAKTIWHIECILHLLMPQARVQFNLANVYLQAGATDSMTIESLEMSWQPRNLLTSLLKPSLRLYTLLGPPAFSMTIFDRQSNMTWPWRPTSAPSTSIPRSLWRLGQREKYWGMLGCWSIWLFCASFLSV